MEAWLKFLLIAVAIQVATSQYPSSCSEALKGKKGSGEYTIQLPHSTLRPFRVYCLEDDLDVRGWTVIQRRVDGRTNFFRSWEEHKVGFGDFVGNFWLGLEKLHALTTDPENPQELWVQVKDNVTADASYSRFSIGAEFEQYRLNQLGTFKGTAGDSLRNQLGMKFTTYDYDNDLRANANCADVHHGGWWHRNCTLSSLNGLYGGTGWFGVMWRSFRDVKSLRFTQMAIRPSLY